MRYITARRNSDNHLSPVLCPLSSERGISLIELIMFILIVSIALVGILQVMNATSKGSADPLVRKQALAIAESLLEEIELMPFTFCDPDDPSAVTATSSAGCSGGAGGDNDESKLPLGPETAASIGGAEGRYASPQFDNVSDYNGFSMAGAAIMDIAGNSIGLAGYAVSAVVGTTGCAGIAFPNALPITVTATGPDSVPIVLDGCRTRYSPQAVP